MRLAFAFPLVLVSLAAIAAAVPVTYSSSYGLSTHTSCVDGNCNTSTKDCAGGKCSTSQSSSQSESTSDGSNQDLSYGVSTSMKCHGDSCSTVTQNCAHGKCTSSQGGTASSSSASKGSDGDSGTKHSDKSSDSHAASEKDLGKASNQHFDQHSNQQQSNQQQSGQHSSEQHKQPKEHEQPKQLKQPKELQQSEKLKQLQQDSSEGGHDSSNKDLEKARKQHSSQQQSSQQQSGQTRELDHDHKQSKNAKQPKEHEDKHTQSNQNWNQQGYRQPPQPAQVNHQPPQPAQVNYQPPQPAQVNNQPPQPAQVNYQPPQPAQVNHQPPQPAQKSNQQYTQQVAHAQQQLDQQSGEDSDEDTKPFKQSKQPKGSNKKEKNLADLGKQSNTMSFGMSTAMVCKGGTCSTTLKDCSGGKCSTTKSNGVQSAATREDYKKYAYSGSDSESRKKFEKAFGGQSGKGYSQPIVQSSFGLRTALSCIDGKCKTTTIKQNCADGKCSTSKGGNGSSSTTEADREVSKPFKSSSQNVAKDVSGQSSSKPPAFYKCSGKSCVVNLKDPSSIKSFTVGGYTFNFLV